MLPSVVSGLGEVVSALLRRDGSEDLADGVTDGVDGSLAGFAQEVLELGKGHLDRVEKLSDGGEGEACCWMQWMERNPLGRIVQAECPLRGR